MSGFAIDLVCSNATHDDDVAAQFERHAIVDVHTSLPDVLLIDHLVDSSTGMLEIVFQSLQLFIDLLLNERWQLSILADEGSRKAYRHTC